MRGYSWRATTAVLATAALIASAWTMPGSPAAALSPGINFSADDLPTWQTDGVVYALAQTQGRVIAGGTFTTLRPPTDRPSTPPVATTALAILDAESGNPDSCQLPVTISTPGARPQVRALTASPDGTVYVGGDFSSIGGIEVGRLAAIDVLTCTVKPFRTGVINSVVRSVALHGSTLYFGGDFDEVSYEPRQHFAAVESSSGDLIPWVADADQTGRAIAVSPDGKKVALGGDFFFVNGSPTHSIAVVDGTTGANLRTYPDNFIDDRSVTKHIWSGATRFYVSNEGSGSGRFDGRLAIDWGTLDQVWRDTCRGATQASIEYAGTLYSASHAHDCSENAYQDGRRNHYNAQDAATATLLGWDPRANDGIGEGVGPRALTIAIGRTSGAPYLWSGGEFTQINGQPQQGLTRFGIDDVGRPPVPLAVAEATPEGSIQVRWRTVVDPDDSKLTYFVHRNGSRRPIWTGSADSLWWKYPQITFVDTKVVAGKKYTYRVRASDGTQSSALSPATAAHANKRRAKAYGATIRADRPTLYWNSQRGGPGGLWVQEVGSATTGTRRLNGRLQGGTVTVYDSPLGDDPTGSLRYDGVDDYTWADEYVVGPTVYSLEAWFKTRSRKGGGIIGYGSGRPRTDNFERKPSTSRDYDRVVYLDKSGRVRFGVDAGRRIAVSSRRKSNDGRWHHVVATQGQAGMTLYLDGKTVAKRSTSRAGTYKGVWHVGGDNLAKFPKAPSSSMFAGLIDEVAIYPKALKRKRVVAHFRAARRAARS